MKSSRIAILFNAFVMPFLVTTTLSVSYNGGNETDHPALLSFKSMITHDPYGALSSWNTSFHFCDWIGVSCGKRHRRATVVKLVSRGLTGSLSPHVGNLSFLRVLWLSNNSFQGTIPNEISRLSRLRVLDLGSNEFDGIIPSNLSGGSIEIISLGYNKLVGSIPKEFSFLSKLTYLSIHMNKLTGGIPPFLGNITSMEVFSVPGNPLGGSIPDTLGHLKSIREFYAAGCNLHGTIPRSFYNMSLLSRLSFASNQLNGSLPRAIGAMLPHLTGLQLCENQLTGPLPPSISNCSKLQHLELWSNRFSGKLTTDFSNLRDIVNISLYRNFFGSEDADEMRFIDSMKNCSRLQALDLGKCQFQGVLPPSIGNLSNQLKSLYIGGNQLHGNLHSSIGNLVGLEALRLDGNRFTGNIPSTIGMLQKLQVVVLGRNRFSGPIPDAIGNLSSLVELYIDSNRLGGNIPSSLGNCHNLLSLDLSNNNLTGKIPKQILQLSSLSILLDISRNNLFGSLPTEIRYLKMLSSLNISDNNLSGNIPSTLGACTSLSFLSLKGNFFQGSIPSSLSSLRGLVKLDVSQNNLSGKIPRFLERFSFEALDLSYNDFEGEVPMLGVFSNASAFSIVGNNRMCGGLVELGLPKCTKTKKHKRRFLLIVIVIFIAITLCTILCLVYIWSKKKSKGQPSQSSTSGRFLKVSYNQLLKATNGFSVTNLIGDGGSGSVYKGTLDHDNRVVAVKVLHLQNKGALKSFIAECEAWRTIRHRNLLKIITSCSSVDFQGNDFRALVYEFMPNGSLHDWLHSSENTSRLNLVQRIRILLDVASALDYLHNRCVPTIVHCDLKPSNILIDDDMVAHVGDFGLARFLGTNSNQSNSTGVKGTIGYAPPEYGMGSEMTSSGDVYSFGILLLEVMTGKRPTDDMFNEGFCLHNFANGALPNHVTNVIDGDAISLQSTEANAKIVEECLSSTVKIGVSCSLDAPPQRMTIATAVHELQHILDALQNIIVT